MRKDKEMEIEKKYKYDCNRSYLEYIWNKKKKFNHFCEVCRNNFSCFEGRAMRSKHDKKLSWRREKIKL